MTPPGTPPTACVLISIIRWISSFLTDWLSQLAFENNPKIFLIVWLSDLVTSEPCPFCSQVGAAAAGRCHKLDKQNDDGRK